jgi:hypothetical protein
MFLKILVCSHPRKWLQESNPVDGPYPFWSGKLVVTYHWDFHSYLMKDIRPLRGSLDK